MNYNVMFIYRYFISLINYLIQLKGKWRKIFLKIEDYILCII